MQRLETSITDVLVPADMEPWPEICDRLNSKLHGWSNHFCLGTRQGIFRAVDRYIYERVRDFLARRHNVAGRGTRRFSHEAVHATGLMRLEASR